MLSTIELEPLSGLTGAEVHGVDLSTDLSDATVAAIREAFIQHHVLVFRDQRLSPEQQLRFGRRSRCASRACVATSPMLCCSSCSATP